MDALVLLVASGGLIGLIPASIRASVLDLDKKGDTDGVSLFPCWAFSISGIGLHLWYDTIPGLTRRALPGVGDVIGDRQYVILTEDGANAALVAAESISNRQLPFPSELFGPPSLPPANNAPQTGGDVGEWAWWRFPHPVVAYEGQRHTLLFKLLLTAPRVGGGTPWHRLPNGPLAGLSPRGRGNRSASSTNASSAGSIPAWAGEPLKHQRPRRLLPVYPRVGGGTFDGVSGRAQDAGLSPRGRGNPSPTSPESGSERSIPSWAGEPSRRYTHPSRPTVYPRVGGGTRSLLITFKRVDGLSPRGRGNLAQFYVGV